MISTLWKFSFTLYNRAPTADAALEQFDEEVWEVEPTEKDLEIHAHSCNFCDVDFEPNQRTMAYLHAINCNWRLL